jgi:hypothetical protein
MAKFTHVQKRGNDDQTIAGYRRTECGRWAGRFSVIDAGREPSRHSPPVCPKCAVALLIDPAPVATP